MQNYLHWATSFKFRSILWLRLYEFVSTWCSTLVWFLRLCYSCYALAQWFKIFL